MLEIPKEAFENPMTDIEIIEMSYLNQINNLKNLNIDWIKKENIEVLKFNNETIKFLEKRIKELDKMRGI